MYLYMNICPNDEVYFIYDYDVATFIKNLIEIDMKTSNELNQPKLCKCKTDSPILKGCNIGCPVRIPNTHVRWSGAYFDKNSQNDSREFTPW